MKPLWLTLTLSLTLQASTDAASRSFDEQVAQYIEKFPYQATYDLTVRFTGGDPAKINTWVGGGTPALVKAGDDIVPRTNNDTYYKGAALFLDDGPVVIEARAPASNRFNSLQLVDDRNVNYRNVLYPSGKYTLYFGDKPERFEGEAIEVPSKLSVVLARVEVRNQNDAEDVAAAASVFHGLTIAGAPPRTFPRRDWLGGYPSDVAAEAHRRMDAAAATIAFSDTVVGPGQQPGREVSFLHHAAGTKIGWGGPDPQHSAYEAIFFDANGDELRGRNGPYVVTTSEPPVDAFWSITIYDTERGGFLHPNDGDRYHVNDTAAVRNADGTVTLTFKEACGAADSNCLEVPAGRFDVAARYYLPRTDIVSGIWRFPKILAAD